MPEAGLRPDPSWSPLDMPADWAPQLVVVIDTEEEFDWDAPFDPGSPPRRTFSISRWRRRSWIATAWCRPMLWTIPLPTRLRPWPFFAPLPMKDAARSAPICTRG